MAPTAATNPASGLWGKHRDPNPSVLTPSKKCKNVALAQNLQASTLILIGAWKESEAPEMGCSSWLPRETNQCLAFLLSARRHKLRSSDLATKKTCWAEALAEFPEVGK